MNYYLLFYRRTIEMSEFTVSRSSDKIEFSSIFVQIFIFFFILFISSSLRVDTKTLTKSHLMLWQKAYI